MIDCNLAFNLGFNSAVRNLKSNRYWDNDDEESAFEYGIEMGIKFRDTGKYEEYLYPLIRYNKYVV